MTEHTTSPRKTSKAVQVREDSLPDPAPALRLPIIGLRVVLPSREQIPWMAGLCLAAAVDLIDWPVALFIAVGHTLATEARNDAIRELAGGLEAGI